MFSKICRLFIVLTLIISPNSNSFGQNHSEAPHTGPALLRELGDAFNDQGIRWRFEYRTPDESSPPETILLNFNQNIDHCVGDYSIRVRGEAPLLGYDYNFDLRSDRRLRDSLNIVIRLDASSDSLAQTLSTRTTATHNELYLRGSNVTFDGQDSYAHQNYYTPLRSSYLLEDVLLHHINEMGYFSFNDRSHNNTRVDGPFILTPEFRMQIHQATFQLGMIYYHLFRGLSLIQHLPADQQARDNPEVREAFNSARRVCGLNQRTSSPPRPDKVDPLLIPTSTAFMNRRPGR